MIKFLVSMLCACAAFAAMAQDQNFRFESIETVDAMHAYVRQLPLGTSRAQMRERFVGQGGATLKTHPVETGVEKYIYDINLCSYYIWRWNISADYDAAGRLKQSYVNGDPVFPEGTPKREVSKVAEEGKKASLYKAFRPRPEASKGEQQLAFVLFDRDSDSKTIGDRAAIGMGPSRADPANMGTMKAYTDVDPWRSIFDLDNAQRIAPYAGDCAAADRRWAKP